MTATIAILNQDGTVHHITQTFSIFNSDLDRLRDWLLLHDCHHALMESTGKYWIPVFNRLEPYMEVHLTHPKYVRAIKGRKTDKNDSIHIADLFMNDQVYFSYIPPLRIRELRSLARYRCKLVYMRNSEKNRYQNCLTVSNVALASVLSDSLGKSALAIMEYIQKNPSFTDADILKLILGKARKHKAEILEAVHGCAIPDIEKLKINAILSHLRYLDAQIDNIEAQMALMIQPYQHLIDLLCTIPGIGTVAATQIIAEIGTDMSMFESSKHLAHWAGLSSGNDESAGKKKNVHISRAGVYLKPMLIQCARSAARCKYEPYFANKYYRLKHRKGDKRAITAIARMMLTCIYQILSLGEVFNPTDLYKKEPVKNTPHALTVESALAFLAKQGYDVSSIKQPDGLPVSG
jgi:transposase